jgi:ankyrin repeat protein
MLRLSQDLISRTKMYNCETRIEEVDEDGKTALLYAVENEHFEVVELLLELGADVETKNRHGQTPLELMMGKEHHKMVKLLRDCGAA